MTGNFFTARLDKVLSWSRSRSLWYFPIKSGCCADELLETGGSRYDLERFGCLPKDDPSQADLLIVTGMVSKKAAPEIRQIYDAMLAPKYVIAVGACACSGGAFVDSAEYAVVRGVKEILPVDVYVPGCPPRPEAIMNGLIALQEKISGIKRAEIHP